MILINRDMPESCGECDFLIPYRTAHKCCSINHSIRLNIDYKPPTCPLIALNLPMIMLPKDMTNGDVIKALFPDIVTEEFCITVHATTKVESNGAKGGISFGFWKEWWNAPYERSKDENRD